MDKISSEFLKISLKKQQGWNILFEEFYQNSIVHRVSKIPEMEFRVHYVDSTRIHVLNLRIPWMLSTPSRDAFAWKVGNYASNHAYNSNKL